MDRRPVLLDQKDAIRDYLDSLLQEVPEDDSSAPELTTKPQIESETPEVIPKAPEELTETPQEVATEATVIDEATAIVTEATEVITEEVEAPSEGGDITTAVTEDNIEPSEIIAEAPTVEPEIPSVEVESPPESFDTTLEQIESITLPPEEELIDGVPKWASPSFQCLFFYVGIIKLAVPLVKLNGVVPFSDTCTKPPKSPDWYCGVMIHRDEKIKVIDTAELVVPADYDADETGLWPNNVLKIGEDNLGISCTKIGEVKRINPKSVRWRTTPGGKRPWLLGTIKEHLCVLLDTDGILKMIKELGLGSQ